MKLELARAMLYNADLLLLDEVRGDSVLLFSR
jgi:ABC-type branched-subunit amino acid transport system ATPase component